MIRYRGQEQPNLVGFVTLFERDLDGGNRWVKLSECVPWDELADGYYRDMSSGMGRPAKDARLVIGAVIIKHKLCLSDEETIEQIRENPYLQYFVGLKEYQSEAPFVPTLFVEIRRRMGEETFSDLQQAIVGAVEKHRKKTDKAGGSEETKEKLEREEYRQRIPIEGKFGQGKNGYGLSYIRAKTARTSEAWIRSIFLVMNLIVLQKAFLLASKTVAVWRISVQFTLHRIKIAFVTVFIQPYPPPFRLNCG